MPNRYTSHPLFDIFVCSFGRDVHARRAGLVIFVDDPSNQPHRPRETAQNGDLHGRSPSFGRHVHARRAELAISVDDPSNQTHRPQRRAQTGDLHGRSPSFGRDVHAGCAESVISVDDPSNQPSRPQRRAQNGELRGRSPSFEARRIGKRLKRGKRLEETDPPGRELPRHAHPNNRRTTPNRAHTIIKNHYLWFLETDSPKEKTN